MNQGKKERKHKMNNRNKRGDITTESTDIKKIIMDYYQQLYANKFDDLDEMDKFKRHNLKAHAQKQIT